MKIKDGVSIHGISPAFHFIMPIIQATYHQYNVIEDCVITSGTEKTEDKDRTETSLHLQGRAIDLRSNCFPNDDRKEEVLKVLQHRLHEEFTIEDHGDHFHIEYHPSENSYFPVQAQTATNLHKVSAD